MVIAFAGRRVDGPDAEQPRFPPERVDRVAEEIRNALDRLRASVLVCSAASGADILALEAATGLYIRRRVVLPFDRHQFRKTSVVDRSSDWGPRYDRILDDLEQSGDVVVLSLQSANDSAYTTTNERIIAEAVALDARPRALIVWDGKPRGSDDATAQFLARARKAGLPTTEILTLP